MRSLTPGTKFQYWSTARTVIVNGFPAVWLVGVPLLPEAVPPSAVSPGRRTWSPKSGPGLTTNALLVPIFGGAEKSRHVSATAPPAPLSMTCPVHVPAENVIKVGVMLPVPVFAWRTASPA